MEEPDMAISEAKEVAVGRLRPNPANARTHSKKQIGQIARSIQQFGFTSPIVVDENWFILAGHGRWLAANALGLLQVPVVVVSGLSQAERQTYLITDNKLTENAGCDRPKLAAELHQLFPLLETAGLDIELTGFSTAEIDALSGDLIDPEQDPADELPEIAKYAVSRRGDCWQLGHHRMLCGDARNPTDFHNLMVRSCKNGVYRSAIQYANL
jgi:ParB-like chromosome segregation protein Spo0J